MSLKVPLDELRAVVEDYGATAYVVTGAGTGAPRITHVSPRFVGDTIEVVIGGNASRAAVENPQVSLLWPATEHKSMSVIVDGVAQVEGEPGPDTVVRVTPTGAVRHRSAPAS